MTKIYYFSPNCDCDLLASVPLLTELECENERLTNSDQEVFLYTPQEFERAFYDEFISDLGLIRIF